MDEGHEEGCKAGLQEGIKLALEAKFGLQAREVFPKIQALGDVAALRQFGHFLITATTLDQVRKYMG